MSDPIGSDTDMDTDMDLKDVFKLMYDDEEDDWALEEDDHPPLDSLVPDLQLDITGEVQDDYLSRAYSRKRSRTQLDALLPISTKKRRIFPSTPRQSYYPSTLPLPPLPSHKSFEPFNPLSHLARLRTFHPSLYSPFLPQSISPARLAGNGWFCTSRDGVECACGAKWGVAGLLDIKDGRVREEIGRRLAAGMEERHIAGCGWRILSSPNDIMSKLRNILHTPIGNNIAALAISLPPLDNLSMRTRLSEKQQNNLLFALSRHSTVSITQAELGFFGWAPHPLSADIIQCRICQRRLGLWAFTSSATEADSPQVGGGLDPVGEHLGWCPLGIENWWDNCALLKGGRGNVEDLTIGKGVKRRKWIKA